MSEFFFFLKKEKQLLYFFEPNETNNVNQVGSFSLFPSQKKGDENPDMLNRSKSWRSFKAFPLWFRENQTMLYQNAEYMKKA